MTTTLTPSPKQKFFDNNGSPLNKGQFTIFVFTLISSLLRIGRPSAISRLIVSIIVNAIKSQSFFAIRSHSHIFKEVFKSMPALAYNYAPASIIWIANKFIVIAAINHRSINSIIIRICHPMSFCSFSNGSPASFASTRNCVAASKIARAHIHKPVAFTPTVPFSWNLPTSFNFMDSNQIAKLFASEYWGFHGCNPTGTTTK